MALFWRRLMPATIGLAIGSDPAIHNCCAHEESSGISLRAHVHSRKFTCRMTEVTNTQTFCNPTVLFRVIGLYGFSFRTSKSQDLDIALRMLVQHLGCMWTCP